MTGTVSEQVRHFLAENFILSVDQKIGDHDSLLELRVIDSTGFLELVAFLESNFSIKVDDSEMLPENLETIANICNFVTRKQESR